MWEVVAPNGAGSQVKGSGFRAVLVVARCVLRTANPQRKSKGVTHLEQANSWGQGRHIWRRATLSWCVVLPRCAIKSRRALKAWGGLWGGWGMHTTKLFGSSGQWGSFTSLPHYSGVWGIGYGPKLVWVVFRSSYWGGEDMEARLIEGPWCHKAL